MRVAELLCANSGRERTSAIVYAVGWTQHTTGVQIIRAAGILQLLLGNMGRPGGGIMAMRGHASIQGSTDIPTLYDLLPGYLPQPAADEQHETLDDYVEYEGLPTGYWANFRKFIVSLLKAWYGDAATPENDFRFDWLPRIDGDYSQLPFFDRMAKGEVKGYFLFGQNPAGGGPNAGLHRAGLRNLDWLVVLDWFETESAVFWKNDPNGPPPPEIKTEVFFIPAAAVPEKEGSFTNTQRLLQWHDKALDPPGDCRSDAWFVYNLGKRLKELYAGSTDAAGPAAAEPHLGLRLRRAAAAARRHAQPHRGRAGRREGAAGDQRLPARRDRPAHRAGRGCCRGFAELKDDGTTACGCWIYSGVFPEPGRNRARERKRHRQPARSRSGASPGRTTAAIMYNRASADPEGRPWSERKKLRLVGRGRSRSGSASTSRTSSRTSRRLPAAARTRRAWTPSPATQPFIMKPDGVGWLFAPGAVKDGPLPTHYEPVESPVGNLLYPEQHDSPTVRYFEGPLNRIAHAPTTRVSRSSRRTFRLTEHYLSGPMSRFNCWLNELQPEMFVELSPELAAERGIEHGGWLTVRSPRGRDRGAGDGDAAAAAAADRRARGPPDRPAVPLGLRRRDRSAATPTT